MTGRINPRQDAEFPPALPDLSGAAAQVMGDLFVGAGGKQFVLFGGPWTVPKIWGVQRPAALRGGNRSAFEPPGDFVVGTRAEQRILFRGPGVRFAFGDETWNTQQTAFGDNGRDAPAELLGQFSVRALAQESKFQWGPFGGSHTGLFLRVIRPWFKNEPGH